MRRRKRGGRTEEEYKEEGSGWITKVLIARFIIKKMLQTGKIFPNSLPLFNNGGFGLLTCQHFILPSSETAAFIYVFVYVLVLAAFIYVFISRLCFSGIHWRLYFTSLFQCKETDKICIPRSMRGVWKPNNGKLWETVINLTPAQRTDFRYCQ